MFSSIPSVSIKWWTLSNTVLAKMMKQNVVTTQTIINMKLALIANQWHERDIFSFRLLFTLDRLSGSWHEHHKYRYKINLYVYVFAFFVWTVIIGSISYFHFRIFLRWRNCIEFKHSVHRTQKYTRSKNVKYSIMQLDITRIPGCRPSHFRVGNARTAETNWFDLSTA